MAEPLRTTATELKKHFGKYLDATRTRRVIIHKQGRPAAVLISFEEYEILDPPASMVIDRLTGEFERLVSRMQRPEFNDAMKSAFQGSPEALGEAHRRGMKRGGS